MDWLRKYQPKHLDDVVGQDEVISRLKQWAMRPIEDLLNFMFIGIHGTGKTSAARAFCTDANIYFNVVNAAEYNTIDKLKQKGIGESFKVGGSMTDFMEIEQADGTMKPLGTHGLIWIVEKGENLNDNAQDYLEQVLDDGGNAIRMIICCNEDKFTDAFNSRFQKFKFNRVGDQDIRKLATRIAENEGFKVPEEYMERLIEKSEGIPRLAVRGLYEYYIQTVGPKTRDR